MQLGVRNDGGRRARRKGRAEGRHEPLPQDRALRGSAAPSSGTASQSGVITQQEAGALAMPSRVRLRGLQRALARYQAGKTRLQPTRLHRHRHQQGQRHPVRFDHRHREAGAGYLSDFRSFHGRLFHQRRPAGDDRHALPASAGYCRLRSFDPNRAVDPANPRGLPNEDPSVICVGSPSTANLVPSLFDAFYETDKPAQPILEHRSGSRSAPDLPAGLRRKFQMACLRPDQHPADLD